MRRPSIVPLLLIAHAAACVGTGTSVDDGSADLPIPGPMLDGQPSNDPDARAPNTSSGAGDERGDGGTMGNTKPHFCLFGEPNVRPCTISETYGVFVSATAGSDTTGDGTRGAPLATIGAGIRVAKQTKRRLYACGETYRENVTAEEGVAMYGYFRCEQAKWSVDKVWARVLAPSSPALTAIDIVKATRVESFSFETPDAAVPGGSSIAMRVVRSPGVHFLGGRLIAGNGAHGASGAAAPQLTASSLIHGEPSIAQMSASACVAQFGSAGCTDHFEQRPLGGVSDCVGAAALPGGDGGNGGRAGLFWTPPSMPLLVATSPEPGEPAVANATTAKGATSSSEARGGLVGADGVDGASATGLGTFTAVGYFPANGVAGTSGLGGQGGGGGAAIMPQPLSVMTPSVYWYGASGAGGGAGGCPGLAGGAGQGGGASVALLAYDSPLRFEDSVVQTGSGGDGGKGSLGSEPTRGGNGGTAAGSRSLARGGDGGRGGRPGVSGHGAGGPSVLFAVHGAAPQVSNITTSSQGLGGKGQLATYGAGRMIGASSSGQVLHTFAF